MSIANLPISVFDLLLVVVLAAGLFSGRRHGMSAELLDLAKWVAVIFGAAAMYEALGRTLAQTVRIFGLLSCFLVAYLLAAGLIFAIFALVKRAFGGKLLGSDIFGRAEYYLGMLSGMIRYSCVLLAALAMLNARLFTANEVRAMNEFQRVQFGSDLFPTLHTLQTSVFQHSMFGPWIHQNLSFLLIKPTSPDHHQALHMRDPNLSF
jgi:uncharacterized membrane protein required for colicin V production